MKKIAIFGGTFNPVHWGHLLIAETALDQGAIDQVIWVPSCHPPHKSPVLLAFEHRLEMVQLAIADHPKFSASDIEARQVGLSYAIETLHALQALQPDAEWYWIIGLDAFQLLPQWRASREIAAQCSWLIAPREENSTPSEPVAKLHQSLSAGAQVASEQVTSGQITSGLTGQIQAVVDRMATQTVSLRWQVLHMPPVGVSSSLVRQYCHDRRSIRYLVPESVRAYILSKHFYQND